MDEDDDESAVGAAKYPVMPSLLTLQHMRNRLHLSYLGKKLMKWTALATGRELRKLAMAMELIYRTFYDDVTEAYLMLARCRYFYPDMNKMVLENPGNIASVRVIQFMKAMTGVKVVQFDILESGVEPYAHLGLEKGGQQIHEAKLAWLDLVKRLILMLELRTCFVLVEAANRSANTRMNVMNKVAIPRTKATIHYILIEMEEMAREELYRIKVTKKKKVRDAEKLNKDKKVVTEPEPPMKLAFTEVSVKETVEQKSIPVIQPPVPVPTKLTLSGKDISKTPEQKSEQKPQPVPVQKPEPVPVQKPEHAPVQKPEPARVQKPQPAYLQKPQPAPVQKPQPVPVPVPVLPVEPVQANTAEDNRLETLKALLSNVIALGKEVVNSGINNIDIEEFLQNCDEAKMKISNLFTPDDKTNNEVDPALTERLNNLKSHLREVVSITNDFKNSIKVTKSVENFIESCEEADNKLNLIVNAGGKSITVGETSSRNTEKSSDEKETSSKSEVLKGDLGKLKNLTDNVTELEKMSAGFKTGGEISGLDTNNLENLSIRCKEFRDKLAAYKDKVNNSNISKLLLTEFPSTSASTIENTCSSGGNMNRFLELCDNLNKIVDQHAKGTENLDEVYKKLDNVISSLKQFKDEVIESPRLAEFMKNYEKNVHERKAIDKLDASPNDKAKGKKESKTSLVSDMPSCSFDKESDTAEGNSKILPYNSEQEYVTDTDNAVGSFEKTMKKVKVTRTLNEDGTIHEETRTIIIRKRKQDPQSE
ncbi:hypothetical protein ACJJTC_010966 [Scirpophaga incertulas]